MSAVKTVVDLDRLRYDDRGLIPMVVQDIASGTVLMVGWADKTALELTVETGAGHFFSRSRQQLWRKGETSGHELVARELLSDCDRDTLLLRVDPVGPTCHTGERSCFDGDAVELVSSMELGWLAEVVSQRAKAADPDSSYTARLLKEGLSRVAQKVGEEAVETVIAALQEPGQATSGTSRGALIEESADLLFHLLVLLEAKQVPLSEVALKLRSRHQQSATPGLAVGALAEDLGVDKERAGA